MNLPRQRVVFNDERGNAVASQSGSVSPFRALATQSPDEFLGRDMRNLKVLRTAGTRQVTTKHKAMLDGSLFQIRDIMQNGGYLDMLLERTR